MVQETKLKELICTTHGHELRRGVLEDWGVQGGRGVKGENWENCNSIINKIYIKKYTIKYTLKIKKKHEKERKFKGPKRQQA